MATTWRVPYEKLEEQLGLSIRKGCGLDVLLKEALLDRKEIALAEIADDHITMTCRPDFCLNLNSAIDGCVHGSNKEHKRKLILHLDECRYDTLQKALEMLGYSKQVTGVFDVDLDGGTFSTLDADIGWRTFTAANIRAISHQMEESGITDNARLAAEFRELPYSKQTVNPDRLSLLSGSRSIKAEEITVSECLAEDDGVITFIVDVLADEQEVFGAELFTDEDCPPHNVLRQL